MIQRYVKDGRLLTGWKATGEITAEFGFEQRKAFAAASPVADRVLDQAFVDVAAIVEFHGCLLYTSRCV